MRKAFGIAGGAQEQARNVLVTLSVASGDLGIGEGAPFPAFNGETQEDVLASCAAVDLRGVDVDDTTTIRERLRAASPSARCAIETAVVDARARRAKEPLHVFLAGGRVPESDLVTDITITTGSVDDARREAREFAAFSTLKIKVGGGDPSDDVARIHAVREARPDAKLLIDANAGFTLGDALRFARETRDANIALFEQPVREWDDLVAFRQETRAMGLAFPVAIDESVTCADDVTRARERGAADAVNIKIMKSGIFEALAIAARASQEGLMRMIGGMVESRLAMGTSACIAAGLGGFSFIDLDTPLFLAEDPFTGGYTQSGERLDLRQITAGHGLTSCMRLE
jgi:L-alanine-DL-glutamate epimerase-like enolase superfamily enzyme